MPTLYTIGHSNRSLKDFLALLKAHGIQQIIDVRTVPQSRKMPWFGKDKLSKSLQQHKIGYKHFPTLGGFRHTHKDSINVGFHHASFRGFADYMQTKAFYAGLKKLNLSLKNKRKIAIMCAEALPWRCHRSLIADAEIIRGIKVLDIMSKTNLHKHELTSFAKVDRTRRPMKLYYPK